MDYQNLLEEYQKCNERIAESFDSLDNHHPIYLCGVYNELLENGFFSYQHQFQRKGINLFHSGLSILTGKGNNIQISEHLKDVFDIMNISSKIIKLPPIWSIFLMELPLSAKDFYSFILKNQLIFLIPFRNRHINSVEYSEITYWLDMKNNTYFSQYASDSLFNEFLKLLNIKKFATSLDFKNYFNEGSDYVLSNLSNFEQLYNANQDSYEKITLNLNQPKNYIPKILTKKII